MITIPALIEFIEEEISRLNLPERPANLYEPIRYILEKGGKRLRPLLVLAVYSMFKDDYKNIIKPAIGLEVFHNFTLLHDDIMDKADLRRNRPTVHKKWNENIAILSGDAAMILAYDLLSEADDRFLRPLIKLFNKTSLEVCEGQQYDMDFETRNDVTVDEYMEMIRLKTSVLIAAAMKIGGMLADVDMHVQDKLYEAGINFGLAFQLQDDYLDTFGDTKVFGKKTGNDILEQKKTFLLINACKNADEVLREKIDRTFEDKSISDDEKVETIKNIFVLLGLDKMILEEIDKYYSRGMKIFTSIEGDAKMKDQIIIFFEALKNRNK